ncbi:MAG: rhodanese-like domain-containing protein [Polyangiaceae bacterium]
MSNTVRVDVVEAKRLIDEEGYRYLDVRSVPEWSGGHPEGAANVPLMHAGAGGMSPNPDFLKVAEKSFAKDDKLVVGCAAGKRSARAVQMLIDAGFTNVVDVEPGFGGIKDAFGQVQKPGWQAAGLPVETETPGGSWAELASAAGVSA